MIQSSQRLRKAVIEGNLPITLRLLSRFPELWLNVDPDNNGWCNLHYAAYNGNYLICFHLISFRNKNIDDLRHNKSSATIDMITFDGLTVLHLPCIHHHAQTLHYLLQEFPGKIWLDYLGGPLKQTPVHYSCIYKFTEGLKLLLEFGADWTAVDANGDTCLHACFQFGFLEGLKVLLRFIFTKNPHGAYIDQYYNSKSVDDDQDTKDELLLKFVKFESVLNAKGWAAVDYASSYELVDSYEAFKKDMVAGLDVAPARNFEDPGHLTLEMNGHSSSSSSSILQFGPNHSQTSIPENKVLTSPIVPIQDQLPAKRAAASAHDSKRAPSTPQPPHEQIAKRAPSTPQPANEQAAHPVLQTAPTGRAHSQSLPGGATAPENIFPPAQPSKEDAARKRANTFNYKPPGALTIGIAPAASPRASSGPQTPLMAQPLVLNKTPSLKSVTISPLTRNHKPYADTGGPDTQMSPQSFVSSINTSPMARKKSNNSLSQVFMNLSPLMQEATHWPQVVDAAPRLSHQEALQPPAPGPAVSPVARTGSPASAQRRRSSSSASSIAAKIAFSSTSARASPSLEAANGSRRPSLSKISTFPRRFSRSSSSGSYGGHESPTLRKSKSTNTVYGSPKLSRTTSADSKEAKASPLFKSKSPASSGSSATIDMEFMAPEEPRKASSISFNRVR